MLGAIIGGVLGLIGSNNAANAQQQAAADQIEYSEDTRDMIMELNRPFVDAGYDANNALSYIAGIGEMPENYAGFTATPGYQFRMDEGLGAVGNMAAANGMLNSGATMKALNDYAQGQASAEYSNHVNLLAGIAGSAQNAASGQATALTNNAQMVNNAYGNIGNAQSAGIIGGTNALTGALSNATGSWQYQNALNGGNGITIGGSNSLFGNSWS